MGIQSDRAKRERKTREAPAARGKESLDRFMSEDKFLIRPPKKDRGRRKKVVSKKKKKGSRRKT